MIRKRRFVGIVLLMVAVLVTAAVYVGQWKTGETSQSPVDHPAEAHAEEYYTCPMHPSVVSDRPGACPVCGMALVRRTSQNELTSGELAAVNAVSLSPTQRVTANVSTAVAERRLLVKEISA
ncbi:MAG: efflux RND transporter periplasmic adaptor subunit, partial [Ignavibacteria bacterium]|nr:efflux RND transporter periplasmic adaptor subunit [Ignavibacteria bacterium]